MGPTGRHRGSRARTRARSHRCAPGFTILGATGRNRASKPRRRRSIKEEETIERVPDVLDWGGRDRQPTRKTGAENRRCHQNCGNPEMDLRSDGRRRGESVRHKPGHVGRHGLGVRDFGLQTCRRAIPGHLRFHGECHCQYAERTCKQDSARGAGDGRIEVHTGSLSCSIATPASAARDPRRHDSLIQTEPTEKRQPAMGSAAVAMGTECYSTDGRAAAGPVSLASIMLRRRNRQSRSTAAAGSRP